MSNHKTKADAEAAGWVFSEMRDSVSGTWLTRYAATNRINGDLKQVVGETPASLLVAINDTTDLLAEAHARGKQESAKP
jgi:hypothetical protein